MKKNLIIGLVVGAICVLAVPVFAVIVHQKKQEVSRNQVVVPIDIPVKKEGNPLIKKVVKEPIILVYHTVEPKTDKKEGAMQKQYHIYPENFKAQMQYLKNNGYTVISMKDYLGYLNSENNVPEKSVVLTFDDGWENQHTYAYPILKEFGYTATFYIITNTTGGKSYMSWGHIKELENAGMDIESHTATHQNLTKINMETVKKELTISKNKLEAELGHTIGMVAYPYYGNNLEVQKIVQEVGYTSARAGWAKYKNSKEVLFALTSQEAVNNKNPFSSVREK